MATRSSIYDGVLWVLLIGNDMTLEDFLAHIPGHGSIKANQQDGFRRAVPLHAGLEIQQLDSKFYTPGLCLKPNWQLLIGLTFSRRLSH